MNHNTTPRSTPSRMPARTLMRTPTCRAAIALMLAPICALSPLPLTGCAAPGTGPSSSRAFTPPKYVEHRVLFARDDAQNKDIWNLQYGYQLRSDEYIAQNAIKPGDPISVIVSDVYLPRDFSGSKDVVVLVDIHTSETRGTESYAVWYQRGVRGGQRLGFDSLLVYSDRAWSPLNPPRFTLRVIDVSKERNQETRAMFEKLNTTVGGLSSFIPHPAFLGASMALSVAGLVMGNRNNVTIIDFTPQFFSADFISNAGQNDLPLFAQGQWLVVGRAPIGSPILAGTNTPEEFWLKDLQLHRRTGLIFDKETQVVSGSPYIRMTIAAADSTVPKVVLDHSKELFELLSESAPSGEALKSVSDRLQSGMIAYATHKNFLSTKSKVALVDLFGTIGGDKLNSTDKSFMIAVASRITGQSFTNPTEAITWWQTNKDKGNVNPTTGRWEANK
jgi:hypothetical protein